MVNLPAYSHIFEHNTFIALFCLHQKGSQDHNWWSQLYPSWPGQGEATARSDNSQENRARALPYGIS